MLYAMSRKFTVTLILILFLLPIGSWYYLRSGLKWRKEAQALMNGTEPMPALPLRTVRGTRLDASVLEEHVSLLTVLSCLPDPDQEDLLRTLYRQFKDTKKANFIFLDTCQAAPVSWVDTLRADTYRVACRDSLRSCYPLWQTWPAGKPYALVDRKGILRSYYTAGTKEEKRMLVEHMALLIPREHTEKVELKRNSEKQ